MSSPPSGETASWDNQHQRRASDPEVVVSKSGTSGTATEDTAPAGDKSKPRLPLPLPTALPELEIHIVSPGPGDERKGGELKPFWASKLGQSPRPHHHG